MAANKYNQSIIEDCLAYFNQFESEGISAYVDADGDGSIYVSIRGFDTVQISKAEVLYRAEIFQHRQSIIES
jgi:hypothetical protein